MSRLSKNIMYNVLGQGLLLLLGFVAVKYVFKRLGADVLGLIYFTTTVNTVLCATLGVGISATTLREVAAHFNDEPDYVHDMIRTGSLFFWGAYGLLVIFICWSAPFLVTEWINVESLGLVTATQALRILGIGALLAFPRSFYGSLLSGLQRMEFNNLIDVAMTALQQCGIILILLLGGSLLHVVYWLAVSFGLGVLAYGCICCHFFSFSALIPGFSSSVVSRNLKYMSRMASISVLAMTHTQADKVIVSKLLPVGVFGFYSLAYSMVSRGTLVTSAIAQAAFPSFSALTQAGDRLSAMSQYRKLQDLLCLTTVPLFAAIPFATVPLFTYLLNAEVARTLLLPVTFLCVGFYMNGTLNVPYRFSLAVGKPEITVRLNFYALFVVIPAAVLAVYLFGLVGAGFSWVIYHLFAYAYAVPRICTECLDIPAAKWYWHVLRIAGLAAGAYGGAWVIVRALAGDSTVSMALGYTGGTIAFLTVAYWIMGGELREAFLRSTHSLRLRIAEAL